jgi:hypothetical protein
MSVNTIQDGVEAGGIFSRQRVSISRWVNEPYPAWDQVLTAHDLARLIRRPPWLLRGMAAIGHFPKKHRFRGKKVGWLKADVLEWLTRTTRYKGAATDKANYRQRAGSSSPNQQMLPLKYVSARAINGHTPPSSVAGVSP